MHDVTEGEFFLRHLRSSTAGSEYLFLYCPATKPLRRASLMALLLSYLFSGLSLMTWPNYWISVVLLRKPEDIG